MDSVFVIVTDTISLDSLALRMTNSNIRNKNYNNTANARILHHAEIGVDVGNNVKTINQGQFGFHVGSMFFDNAIPEYNPHSANPWQWLVDLCPKSLRFPSGGHSKFMHLRPYRDIVGPAGLDPIKGYGYDIYEIIRYYDVTDETIDVGVTVTIESILLDLGTDGDCDDCVSWMNESDFAGDFEGFYNKWLVQEAVPDGTASAIEQFVHLIEDIQTAYPSHVVDVIVCLNIFSETATQCKEIIKYLKYDNPILDVNVVGVELGNESYFKSSREMLGFENFGNYWNYIRGFASDPTWTTNFASYVFSAPMLTDHNYINAFKLDPLVACKIGLPARNIDAPSYAFREADPFPVGPIGLTWNSMLRSKYAQQIPGTSIYCFDAVILHPYYIARDNYQDIALLFDDGYTCPVFDYMSLDTRLEPAFTGILGKTSPLALFGNFRDLIRYRFIESYNFQNIALNFGLTTAIKKDLWTTEWNILADAKDLEFEEKEEERNQIYHNSYASGMVIFEWWLKNLKLNFTNPYRENFFTYSTFHNYHGTSNVNNLIVDADCADFEQYGIDPDDYSGTDRLFLRRTNYYAMLLLSEVIKSRLSYLQANIYQGVANPNNQPTVFIDENQEYLYIYFSNLKDGEQHYIINSDNLIFLYIDLILGTPIGIGLGNATIYCLDAAQAYSTSGKSTIYDLNTCYSCGGETEVLHPFEIRAENPMAIREFENIPNCLTEPKPGETCVTVPGYSLGYFKIPISVFYPPEKNNMDLVGETKLHVYPNPTSGNLNISLKTNNLYFNEILNVSIINVAGQLIDQQIINNAGNLQVGNLSSGTYYIKVLDQNGLTHFASFIKN